MNGMILFLCLIWGFNFVIMKSANGAFPPVLFATFRFFVGAVVLFGVVYLKKIPMPSKRNLTKIQASKASISLLLVPIVGIISSYLFLNESLKISTLIGVLFVLLGIWIVNSSSDKKNFNAIPQTLKIDSIATEFEVYDE